MGAEEIYGLVRCDAKREHLDRRFPGTGGEDYSICIAVRDIRDCIYLFIFQD